jgi:hypothetical protein
VTNFSPEKCSATQKVWEPLFYTLGADGKQSLFGNVVFFFVDIYSNDEMQLFGLFVM